MEPLDEFDPARVAGREEEALFGRTEDDVVVRQERATRQQYEEKVTVTIDGLAVVVPKAKPTTDALGKRLIGNDGKTIPRTTTIYDAAAELVAQGKWNREALRTRIPVLCHKEHLDPVAVCRMCSVHIATTKRGKLTASRKLVPACQHRVEDNMLVTTRGAAVDEKAKADVQRIDRCTRVLAELLVADHLPEEPIEGELEEPRFENELAAVANLVGVTASRFARGPAGKSGRNFDLHSKSRPFPADGEDKRPGRQALPVVKTIDAEHPYSSRTVRVDHDRCILCDRCVRACRDVSQYKVIGHTGKGAKTRISFDLDQVMEDSSCVQCGECMISCPTGALTLNRRVNPLRSWPDAKELNDWVRRTQPGYDPPADARDRFPNLNYFNNPANPLPPQVPRPESYYPSAEELRDVELMYIPPGQVPEESREVPALVDIPPPSAGSGMAASLRTYRPFADMPQPFLRWNEGGVRRWQVRAGEVLCVENDFGSTAFLLESGSYEVVLGANSRGQGGNPVAPLEGGKHLITGEIACLTNTRRTATVRCVEPGVVYEVNRNVLSMMQRTRLGRDALNQFYVRRSIAAALRESTLFRGLSAPQQQRVLDVVGGSARLLRLKAGQAVVQQGDLIGVDAAGRHRGDLYLIRFGSLEVVQTDSRGWSRVVNRLSRPDPERARAGTREGERQDYFGEMALMSPELEQRDLLPPGFARYQRTATVRALDNVELVRIPGDGFRQLLRDVPGLLDQMIGNIRALMNPSAPASPMLGPYLSQGLFQGQKMLVLDLERCTRCDECTKACADAHGDGISRLLRDGPRFGKYLVATSCRSCRTPYCMDGCPVDAIHRGKTTLEVRIDAHCIGCGRCATNCPYESIQMVESKSAPGQRAAEVARKAVNCDLCQDLVRPGAETFCVSACPHEAAFRWDGEELLARVTRR